MGAWRAPDAPRALCTLRGRALFALRNRGGPAAVEALDASLAGASALLKHEVAYVLGQMQDPAAISALECGP